LENVIICRPEATCINLNLENVSIIYRLEATGINLNLKKDLISKRLKERSESLKEISLVYLKIHNQNYKEKT